MIDSGSIVFLWGGPSDHIGFRMFGKTAFEVDGIPSSHVTNLQYISFCISTKFLSARDPR